MKDVKVQYVYHSGYIVEMEDTIFVFDYYKGKLPIFSSDKKVYFFISHKHEDHFNPCIFQEAREDLTVQFFIGSEVTLSEKYLDRQQVSGYAKACIHTIGKYKEVRVDNFTIKTLRSTDAGVAFLIELKDFKIYHGGDLHWWHWSGKEKSKNRNMEVLYKKEVDRLNGENIDLAFLVLDPRQEEESVWGMEYFVSKVKCSYVFPMHMFEQFELIQQVKPRIDSYLNMGMSGGDGGLMEIKESGQEFILWNT